MSYIHDVFISYKRQDEWTGWVRGVFQELLDAYLQQELGARPAIFIDEGIPVGADQAAALGDNLAKSRVLVGIFSADYFGSDWCLHELDLMVGRTAGAGALPGIIIPALVQDGHRIPSPIDALQRADLGEWRRVGINKNWQSYEGFSRAMVPFAQHVKNAILAAPPFRPEWVVDCTSRFTAVLNNPRETELKHIVPKPWPTPTAPPKLDP